MFCIEVLQTYLSTSILLISNEIVEQLIAERRALTYDEDDNDNDHHQSQILFSLIFAAVSSWQVALLKSASRFHQLLTDIKAQCFNPKYAINTQARTVHCV